MKEKMITLILVLILGSLLSLINVQNVSSYGEADGSWSASEKRQVIDLLEEIASNTRR